MEKLLHTLKYNAYGIEIIDNSLYMINQNKFCILDIKTNSMIEDWILPSEGENPVGGYYLKKIDQDKLYFTPKHSSLHYVYYCNIKGQEIQKFGSKEGSQKKGQFHYPAGITVNNKYLYVCEHFNNRVSVVNKENGKFINIWEKGERPINFPLSILFFENLFYVGDAPGIQVFKKEGECVGVFGGHGNSNGLFNKVTGVCLVNDMIYIVDRDNKRIPSLELI